MKYRIIDCFGWYYPQYLSIFGEWKNFKSVCKQMPYLEKDVCDIDLNKMILFIKTEMLVTNSREKFKVVWES
jgi:hypothetical protein